VSAPTAGRFQAALAWNFASLAVLGVAGIALNALIGVLYDESALGIFNQALAAYIFFSQVAVGGLDRSLLKEVAACAHERARVAGTLAAALVPGVLLALAVTLAFWLARGALGRWLDSPGTAEAIGWATPGLFFFALNKLLLATVNGLQRMRAFAVYQALRYVLILAALAGFALLDRERTHAAHLAGVFSFAEALLFLVLVPEVWLQVRGGLERGWTALVRPHLSFGLRSIGSGVLLELNARVDVLMIGWFLSDRDVGIYTFAAMLAEGLYQLVVVLQNLYNPILARGLAARALDDPARQAAHVPRHAGGRGAGRAALSARARAPARQARLRRERRALPLADARHPALRRLRAVRADAADGRLPGHAHALHALERGAQRDRQRAADPEPGPRRRGDRDRGLDVPLGVRAHGLRARADGPAALRRPAAGLEPGARAEIPSARSTPGGGCPIVCAVGSPPSPRRRCKRSNSAE
jgi:hypothetical protein